MASVANAFTVGDYVVYPKHGVGRVIELQSEEIAGMKLDLYVLRFEKERMTLRVPVNKVESIGMRKLSSDKTLKQAMETLKGKPKVKRTMWSRRAQEYEAKINSGDLVSIAEVPAICSAPKTSPNNPIRNARSSKPPQAVWHANWPQWKKPTSPQRSRRSCRSCANTLRNIMRQATRRKLRLA